MLRLQFILRPLVYLVCSRTVWLYVGLTDLGKFSSYFIPRPIC
jgi:hypothetical protein